MFGKGNPQPTRLPPPTQEHVLVQAIQEQCLILKTGDMAAVLEVEGIDLYRLNDDDRRGKLGEYENFLTTLRFPYQFIIARKQQRLEEYLDYVEQQAKRRTHEGRRAYGDFLNEYIEFMKEVVRRLNPQVPLYLLVLPYDPFTADERIRGTATLTADKYRRGVEELGRRSEQIVRGLTRLQLGVRRVDTRELAALLHRVYHPSIPDHKLPPAVQAKNLIVQ